MSDEKSVTEREAVRRERAAWVAAIVAETRRNLDCTPPIATVEAEAKLLYPLPPRIVPRVVTNNGSSWRLVNRVLERYSHGDNRAIWKAVAYLGDPGFEKEIAKMLLDPTTTEVSDE